ncbi:MAG TPA: UDP-N-acetylglucosamine 2-epimerase (non-hydrolyzing) [Bryobacteraceae bacterium]|nr:UDP-N-acetylglucosamine 2-epimerase (non-hydrolyzing) [Bryobacteraceae bacterium]
MRKILFVFGTRPEAIKLAPVIARFREDELFREDQGGRREPSLLARVAVTGQHRGLLDQALDAFGIVPDYDLNVMRPDQSLYDSASRIVAALEPVLARERADLVMVQGDTSTTLCGALAAFYAGVRVGHVEAGLRTGNMRQPFPEEMNRVLTSKLATLHFPPTECAAANLRREGIAQERIFVTGNTGIDAVLAVRDALAGGKLRANGLPSLDHSKKLVLVTAHRRESFGRGFDGICDALARLAARGDVEIVYPVHPNPHVRGAVESRLAGVRGVHLIEPLAYVPFVELMRRSYILLTDSGGIQEEGPSLGKPVLVMRETTERPEAVHAGTAMMVGADADRIVAETTRLLDDPAEYTRRARIHNPYGDGRASARIRDAIVAYFSTS